jgi:hypothetical protein
MNEAGPEPSRGETLQAARPRHTTDRARVIALALLLAAVAWSVGSLPYLPTHDGPQHIYTIHAANHLDDPGTDWQRWFHANTPISSHGFGVFFVPLDAFFDWDIALRAALVAMTLLWALGAYRFAAAVHPERRWVGIALAAAALQWSLYMGFFSFYVASGFGLWVLAFAFGHTSAGRPRLAWLAALLFVQCLLHLMAAIVTGLLVAGLLWFRAGPGQRLRRIGEIAAVGLPALLVCVATVWVSHSGSIAVAEPADIEHSPWWTLGKCLMGGPEWRAWPLTLLAIAAPAAALLQRRRSVAHPASAEDCALWLGGGLLLAAGFALPLHLPSWEFFSVRFLPLAVAALVVTLPVERFAARARAIVATALTGFAFASTGWAYAYHLDLATRSLEPLAGLGLKIERSGARLPIVLDASLGRPYSDRDAMMPYVSPLANLGKLYATAQGGYVPHAFAVDPAIHSALIRDDIPNLSAADPRYVMKLADPELAADLTLREAVTVYLAAHATRYEDVIFWGRPEDVDHLAWLGFAIDWRHGGFAIARFVGCPLRVVLPPGDGLDMASTLEVGWSPALGVTHSYPLQTAHPGEDGGWVLPMRQTCGGIWLRLANEDLRCAGADEAGRLRIGVTGEPRVVECRVSRSISTANNL